MPKSEPDAGTRRRRVLWIAVAGAGALLVLVALGSIVEHRVYSGKVLPGVRVSGASIAGKSEADAYEAVARLGAELQKAALKARTGQREFTVDPAVIGFALDVDATVVRARDAGREGNLLSLVSDTVLRRVRPSDVDLAIQLDEARFQGLLDGWANVVRDGLVEGDLRFTGTSVTEVLPHEGTGLLRDVAEARVRAALARSDDRDIELPIGTVQPSVDAAAVRAAAKQARALLAKNHVIVAGLTQVTLTPQQIARTLGTQIRGDKLSVTIDRGELQNMLAPAFRGALKQPVDATFTVNASGKVSVVPSVDGNVLDVDALVRDLLAGVDPIISKVRNLHPERDTEWAKGLGITEQVGSFTTRHAAGQPRVTNIHLSADALHNAIVEPGATFSLNERLGPRTPEKGYVKAPILLRDGYGEDYGGGVSQLTTTLYNAAWFGGYVDVDHSPHRFYISRYPMGREATINYPSIDLKFRNDTSHGVLIRTSYSSTSITVALYGDNEGRRVREENRRIIETVPVTDELIPCPALDPEDDPENACAGLALLERETVTAGAIGYEVEFERVIDQPGKPQRRERYHHRYPMLPNKILVGTAPPATTTTRKPAATTTTKPVKPTGNTTRTTVRRP
jgi:vancomycin resistance protein YoaR